MKLSQRVQSVAESATLAVSSRAAQLRAQGVDVVGFGAGEPDFPTPPHIVKAANEALANGHTKYSKPATGLPVLKKAICEKLRRENNLEYAANQIISTVGAKDACYLIMQTLLDPGDEVIIPVPYWVSYPEMVKLAGGVPVFVQGLPENNLRVTPEQIREAVTDRTRLLVFNSPNNPGGFFYTSDQTRAVAEVLRGTDVAVLSDEIYDRLIFSDDPYLSFAACDSDSYARTITVNGPSKTYSMTGWRLGFAAGPSDVIKAMGKLLTQDTSGAVTFAQVACAAAMNGDQSCVEEMRLAFAERGRHMCDRLAGMPGIECPQTTGAFYAFPDVSGTFERLGVDSSGSFATKLLDEAGVAVVPGGAFGMDTHVRLSFAISMTQIDEGLNRIANLLQKA